MGIPPRTHVSVLQAKDVVESSKRHFIQHCNAVQWLTAGPSSTKPNCVCSKVVLHAQATKAPLMPWLRKHNCFANASPSTLHFVSESFRHTRLAPTSRSVSNKPASPAPSSSPRAGPHARSSAPPTPATLCHDLALLPTPNAPSTISFDSAACTFRRLGRARLVDSCNSDTRCARIT